MNVEVLGLKNVGKSEGAKIAKVINEIFDAADLKQYSVNVSLMDQVSMEDLCRRFKTKKKITDVLSFPAPVDAKLLKIEDFLGDIAICVDQARKQADQFDHSLLEEIAVLFAHGLFHLLGYDHEESEEESNIQMQGEMYLLEKIGFSPELSLIGRI